MLKPGLEEEMTGEKRSGHTLLVGGGTHGFHSALSRAQGAAWLKQGNRCLQEGPAGSLTKASRTERGMSALTGGYDSEACAQQGKTGQIQRRENAKTEQRARADRQCLIGINIIRRGTGDQTISKDK